MNAALPRTAPTVSAPPDDGTDWPRAPHTPEETGLPLLFLIELLAKLLAVRGPQRLTELAQRLCLPASVVESLLTFLRSERLCEVARALGVDSEVRYALTEAGRARAGEYLARCRYAGPAPVPLAAYAAQVERQSVRAMPVTREAVESVFNGLQLVVRPALRDQLGAALGSGRAIFLWGPAGAGKTWLAERLALLLSGDIAVPHAILVDGEVIQMFDPLVHSALAAPAPSGGLDARARPDPRWVRCQRPVAITGGELTLRMLELEFDPGSGFYQAPPQVKANNGLFVVDDLGRQRLTPQELMNRWIVPMDRRHDYLSLTSGTKFSVPFDVVLVFSTNLQPGQVADPAFLRRLAYKIHVGPLDEHEYRAVFLQACEEAAVPFDEAAFRTLVDDFHAVHDQPLLACYPRDLVRQVADLARYRGEPARLTPAALHWAWHNYFSVR